LSYYSKDKSKKDGFCSQCKECWHKYQQENYTKFAPRRKRYYLVNKKEISCKDKKYYRQNCKIILEKQHVYYHQNCDYILKRAQKYQQRNRGKISKQTLQYRQTHRKQINIRQKKYNQTSEGKITMKKAFAKRKRNLGFTPLMSNPFPVPVDYHHINNTFVVPVPRQVHKSMLGKNHRVKVNNWIEEVIGNVGVN